MNYHVQMTFKLCPAGPMLISSGSRNKLHPELPDNTFLMSWDGTQDSYVIPGSSLKGVLRHYLYQSGCNPLEVDTLFGTAGNQNSKKSRISVSDAYADMKTIETALRHTTALGSVSQSAKGGSLNSMQAVIAGSFSGNIRLSNVNKEEIRLILLALLAVESGEICIGGKISRGFGRVHISDFCMTVSEGYDENSLRPIVKGSYDSLGSAAEAVRSFGQEG